MQIGFVGLGKMGGNMVHRIRRDSEHEVVAFDFSADFSSRHNGDFTVRMLAALRNQFGGHAVKSAQKEQAA